MTEIEMPSMGGYESEVRGKKPCNKICAVVVILIIVGAIGGYYLLSARPTELNKRSLLDVEDTNISIFPIYYCDGFTISSVDVSSSASIYLRVYIYFTSFGSDTSDVTVHLAAYYTDEETVNAAPTWSELDTYLIGSSEFVIDPDDAPKGDSAMINLPLRSGDHSWVLWFESSGKSSSWSLDIDMELWIYSYE